MRELTEWFAGAGLDSKPWLVLGKGPTLDRRDRYELSEYHTLALNHVVDVVDTDVVHIIDIGVVGDCAERLLERSPWLLMPRVPHVRSTPGTRSLEDWFGDYPVLRTLEERGRLVWYNGINAPEPEAGSPIVNTGMFSSEAVLRILGLLGVGTVRSLGIDGGRSYARSFKALEGSTLLENVAPGFDIQFEVLRSIAEEFGIDYRPLVDSLQVFVDTPEAQIVAFRVLEYSIRTRASVPVDVTPLIVADASPGIGRRVPPLDRGSGRVLHLDAAAVVLGDVAELYDLALGSGVALAGLEGRGRGGDPFAGPLLVDPVALPDGLRARTAAPGSLGYVELVAELARAGRAGPARVVPASWDRDDDRDPESRLLRFEGPHAPWTDDVDSSGSALWMDLYREAVEVGAVPPTEVELLFKAGSIGRGLIPPLRSAPSRRSVLTNASLDVITAQRRIADLEEQIAAMRASSSWRIGSRIVQTLSAWRRIAVRLTRRSSGRA